MNWKVILGILLIFGALQEMASVIKEYNSGKFESWPYGAGLGCITLIIGGIYVIRLGKKDKKKM